MPALFSRAFNAALDKRQTRKKHHGICLPLAVFLPLPFTFSVHSNGRASRSPIGGRVKGPRGRIGATRQRSPLLDVGAPFTLLLSLFFACIHVLLISRPRTYRAWESTARTRRAATFIYLTTSGLSILQCANDRSPSSAPQEGIIIIIVIIANSQVDAYKEPVSVFSSIEDWDCVEIQHYGLQLAQSPGQRSIMRLLNPNLDLFFFCTLQTFRQSYKKNAIVHQITN